MYLVCHHFADTSGYYYKFKNFGIRKMIIRVIWTSFTKCAICLFEFSLIGILSPNSNQNSQHSVLTPVLFEGVGESHVIGVLVFIIESLSFENAKLIVCFHTFSK